MFALAVSGISYYYDAVATLCLDMDGRVGVLAFFLSFFTRKTYVQPLSVDDGSGGRGRRVKRDSLVWRLGTEWRNRVRINSFYDACFVQINGLVYSLLLMADNATA